MGKIIVGSQRKGSPLNPPLGVVVVSIGRDSALGNPFDMGRDESLRVPVCEAHDAWLEVVLERGTAIDPVKLAVAMAVDLGLKIASSWKRPTARAIIEELHRIAVLAKDKEVWIICWCTPAMCHGDAYKRVIEDGRVEAAYARLHALKASPEPSPEPTPERESNLLPLLDWRSAITPEAIAQTTFEYSGRWIKNWFSNMEPFDESLVWDGVAYRTPENLYQAMKTSDPVERARIAAMPPSQAKQAGKRVNLRPDWEQVKERYMEVALRHKFKSGTSWHRRLMDTGNDPIVEFNNWHDNFWGACICQTCQPKPKLNRLGVLLMQIRAEYQGDQRDSEASASILPPRPAGNPLDGVEPNSPSVSPHLKRDQAAAAISDQFIGFSARDESQPSMTRKYQQAWAAWGRANTGVYAAGERIMVSGTGTWGKVTMAQIKLVFNEQVKPLLDLAIAAKARFIVGNASGNDQLVRGYLAQQHDYCVEPAGVEGFLEFTPITSASEPPIGLALSPAPQHIEVLEPNQVFVFGTNTEGKHGRGAAGDAFGRKRFRYDGAIGKWAIYGQARGLMQGDQGLSYGIVTKDLKAGERSIPLAEIESQIDELVKFAQSQTDLEFLVTPFGTALAGYSHQEIATLWQGKVIPTNIKLPQIWLDLLT